MVLGGAFMDLEGTVCGFQGWTLGGLYVCFGGGVFMVFGGRVWFFVGGGRLWFFPGGGGGVGLWFFWAGGGVLVFVCSGRLVFSLCRCGGLVGVGVGVRRGLGGFLSVGVSGLSFGGSTVRRLCLLNGGCGRWFLENPKLGGRFRPEKKICAPPKFPNSLQATLLATPSPTWNPLLLGFSIPSTTWQCEFKTNILWVEAFEMSSRTAQPSWKERWINSDKIQKIFSPKLEWRHLVYRGSKNSSKNHMKYSKNISSGKEFPLKVAEDFLEHGFGAFL